MKATGRKQERDLIGGKTDWVHHDLPGRFLEHAASLVGDLLVGAALLGRVDLALAELLLCEVEACGEGDVSKKCATAVYQFSERGDGEEGMW